VVIDVLTAVASSPWVYLVLFAVAALDAFFPVVPSETMVITAGVFAASGAPELAPLVLAAALGAFAGDHISYQIGRGTGRRALRRFRPGGRRQRAYAWAAAALAERGGLLLMVARYVPGGRTATTVTMGATGYPRGQFAAFDAAAALSWALYSAFVGYLGGATFEDDKLKGLLLGLGLAAAITLVVEGVRLLNRRWNLSARFGIRGMSAYRRIATEGGTRREVSPNT